MYGLTVGIGAIPMTWAYATFHISLFLYRRATVGLVPGDHRFNDAAFTALRWTVAGYFLVLPMAVLTLTALLARLERRRGGRWRGAIALCLIALPLAAVSWIVGFVGLAATIWNE